MIDSNPLFSFHRLSPKEIMKFILQEDRMKGVPLGECLESWRWGSYTTVMWETNLKGMVSFIESWINQNKKGYEELFNEKDCGYRIPNLPHINHKECPRDFNHNGTLTDLGGIVRCAHISKKRLKPNFIDNYPESIDDFSQVPKIDYFEREPELYAPDRADWGDDESYYKTFGEEIEEYKREMEKFDEEEQTELITEPCYTILSDNNSVLSLETILRRLNLMPESRGITCDLWKYDNGCSPERIQEMTNEEKKDYALWPHCRGHTEPVMQIEYPFDGVTMAFYVKRWHEQSSNPPLFENEHQEKINQRQLYSIMERKRRLIKS